MKKRIYIIHGWDGNPNQHWLPWLKKELESRNFLVNVPEMPDSGNPRKDAWVKYLADLVKTPDKDTYFVGHSIGCKAVLRYLETLQPGEKIGGAVLVAGWITLTNMDERTPDEIRVINDWVNPPFDFDRIKSHCDNFTAIFSDDDPEVPLEENKETYENKIGAIIIMEHGKGHFTEDDGVKSLPSALQAILEMR
ncbi:MAG: alpha/beta hydrolase [Patescibacteria group bacterium]